MIKQEITEESNEKIDGTTEDEIVVDNSNVLYASKIKYSEDGQYIRFDFRKIPDYGFDTAKEYADIIASHGLPDGRTYLGVYYELLGHYIFYKLDVFDVIDNDNQADIANPEKDPNAWIWEWLAEIVGGENAK